MEIFHDDGVFEISKKMSTWFMNGPKKTCYFLGMDNVCKQNNLC